MSTTMTLTSPAQTTLMSQPPTMSPETSQIPAQCCPNCNYAIILSSPTLEESQSALLKAQHQIDDLQAQVAVLNQKASAAVDRWADYEDELARLRSQLDSQQQRQSTSTNTTVSSVSPGRSSFLPSGAANRISALLSPRKPLPATPPQQRQNRDAGSPPRTPREDKDRDDLLTALSREQFLRREAEGRLNETSREVEELSVSLFEQANEMVATERRARAELEERIEVLERKDRDKRWRLERLEACVGRIERVRDVLEETEGMLEMQTDGVEDERV